MEKIIMEWFAVKGLFRWYFKKNGQTTKIEERIVLFKAASFDTAIRLAEEESISYCQEDPEANFCIEPLHWWNAYSVEQNSIDSGLEVYSRLMDTDLSASSFMKRYYPKSHEQ